MAEYYYSTTSNSYDGGGTWRVWNDSTSCTDTATTWRQWNCDGYHGMSYDTSTSTDTVWTEWNVMTVWIGEQCHETEEERTVRLAEEHRRQEEAKRLAEERERKRKEAEERARRLLIDNLTDEQLKVFEEVEGVPVTAFRSRNKYLIKKGYSGNIHVLDKKGRTKHRLCFHPDSSIPLWDTMLTQKLMLEMAEEDVLRVANRHPA